MNEKLKPCPFCGVNGLPHPLDHKEGCYLRYFFEILAKGASTGGDVMREAWNTRAERTSEVMYDEHGCPRCGECGYVLYSTSGYCPTCGAKVVE